VLRLSIYSVLTGLFPAEAGPTKSIACIQWDLAGTPTCGTGFSREGVRRYTAASTAYSPASSRLKPVPLTASRACSGIWLERQLVGPALAGKASGVTPQHLQRTHRPLPGWSRSH